VQCTAIKPRISPSPQEVGVGPYFAKFFAKFHPFFKERNFCEILPLFEGFGEISAKFSEFREVGTKFREIFVKFRKISAYSANGGPGQKKNRQNFAKPTKKGGISDAISAKFSRNFGPF
jgi:hypothetical protein